MDNGQYVVELKKTIAEANRLHSYKIYGHPEAYLEYNQGRSNSVAFIEDHLPTTSHKEDVC